MKATISQLWDTHRKIISFDDSDVYRPKSFSDLKKCDNVLIGKKITKGGPTEVLIDNDIYLVMKIRIMHPTGCGSMDILEAY
jgi:hypothetical protein